VVVHRPSQRKPTLYRKASPMSEPTTPVLDSADSGELRVGDRITVLPNKARSGHSCRLLTCGFTIEVTHVRHAYDGTLVVEGVLLTARGAWRTGMPTRSVILPPGAYTTPVRVGDTVRYPETGETPVVTAMRLRPNDGTALADLLFTSGATSSGVRLANLEHLARPQVTPTVQPCKRRHNPTQPCNRCAEASEAVTTGCEGPLCRQAADHLVVYWPERGVPQVRALCPEHREAFTARNEGAIMRVFALADGTHSYFAHGDGTQIATCRHCGHAIYLDAALRGCDEPWRDGEYDETGRCTVGEERQGIRVVHQPAVTLAERDYARAAATCTTIADLHPLADCPARRS
jgi:hypothetical protein